ncbi:hypothetical protein BCR33DRAFT_723321 [Rhizoclosmatium globosum]|uniref:Uncharacterized protein n=1 Tax=Rhizoclosmatium globosum TaxID=329046 RepID=A0A1Y2BDU7_9FUNG|nr:hypothetical protein BCR33DRAFT_723321 [Rhizoclosmatium globosum]|eukprot:ORY32983.1 hypothetical protein BCR33DRAFT_723321 [Rhizoclosmatium globosum]
MARKGANRSELFQFTMNPTMLVIQADARTIRINNSNFFNIVTKAERFVNSKKQWSRRPRTRYSDKNSNAIPPVCKTNVFGDDAKLVPVS